MSGKRIVVFAYSAVGHACLKFLLERKENVVAVYTHRDDPGEARWFPSVAELAHAHLIPARFIENLSGESERVLDLSPDLIFSFYYRNLIPGAILSSAALGAYNMHGSFLPKYRGCAPVNWAVLNGERKTGATLHLMTDKADSGAIVDQEALEIGPDDTAIEVQSRVTQAALAVLRRQIDNLKNGSAPLRPQNAAEASYFGRRRPADGEIQWAWPAERIHNLVRAVTHPYPGAFGEMMGERVFIWKTRLDPTDTQGLVITAGDGRKLEILSLQPKGEPEMSGIEFIRRHAASGRSTR